MTGTERPTEKHINALHGYLRDLWADAHAQWRKVDSFYNRSFVVWPQDVDETRPKWRPSKATHIIDHAVDTHLAFEPRVHRPPAGEGERHQQRADRIEPWLQACFLEASLMEPTHPWKQVGKHLLLYGYTVVEAPKAFLRDRPEDEVQQSVEESAGEHEVRKAVMEYERRMWNPIRIRAPHPARVLMDPTDKQPKEAIQIIRRTNEDLHQITRSKKKAGRKADIFQYDKGPYELVTTAEYWSRWWHAILLVSDEYSDGELLVVEPNTWLYLPYAHAFSGFGQEPTDIEKINPVYMAVGMLDPIMDSLTRQAQEVSAKHNALIEAAFTSMGTTRDAAEVANIKAKGGIYEGMQQQDIWYAAFPNLPQWLFQVGNETLQDIEAGSFSLALAGIRQEGVTTVGQQAILSTAANRKFIGPAQQVDHLATIVASNVLRLVDVLGDTITIRGEKISPDDIEHDYSVQVTFEVVDPVLQLQKQQLGLQEYQQGLKSKTRYWSEDARLENISEERRNMVKDLAYQDPRLIKVLVDALLKGQGLEDILKDFEQQGLVPQNGARKLVDQFGQPLAAPMGQPTANPAQPGTPNVAKQALDQLRGGLTPDVAKPPLVPPSARP